MHRFLIVALLTAVFSTSVEAQTLKGTLSVKNKLLTATDFSLVAQTKGDKIQSTAILAKGKFTLNKASTTDRLSLLYKSNYYSPVIIGIKKGKTVKQFEAAVKSGFCKTGNPRVILASKKQLQGSVKIEVDSTKGLGYIKKLSAGQLKDLTKGTTAEATTDCLPSGLSSTNSISTLQISAIRPFADDPNDPDNDGTSNESDVDDDDDGISDSFDPDNDNDGIIDDSDSDNNDQNSNTQLFYFQQLHLDRQDSFHPKLQSVTTEIIDAALSEHGGLALEVKSGNTVELNCGGGDSGEGLPWCSEGGSGHTKEPFPNGLKFPEELDLDSDGKGEITAGGTGDFQLTPGAKSSEIRPGDTFIEEVADSGGVVTKYVGVLNSVVLTVPGIVSVTTDVATYTFDYPATSSSIGTYTNPVLVPSTGDVNISVTLYPPVYNTGSGEIIPGNMTIGFQLPNGPCTYNSETRMCSGGGSGPGLLPGTLFSNPSTGWSVANDGIRSSLADRSVNDAESVSFTVNLTGSGGVTGWDSGESLMVPIQAFDNNGTTSAHNVIFKRQ